MTAQGPYDHGEIQSLLGAYALDAVEGDEREAVHRHLAECPRCRAEVAEHRNVASLLASTRAPLPDGLWDRIAASLEQPPPVPRLLVVPDDEARAVAAPAAAAPQSVPAPRRRRAWPSGLAVVAAAAAVVIVALGVVVIRQDRRIDAAESQFADRSLEAAASAALADPDAHRLTLSPTGGSAEPDARLVAVVLPDGQGYVLADNLPGLGPDRTYQLWGVGEAEPVSLAVMGADPGVVPFAVGSRARSLVVTDEREGGAPAPEGTVVVSGELI